jgi:dephospho-CoA kinase
VFVLGLTGSIGMGKSTTAAMFRALGVPVHDSDAAVHRLYAERAAPAIEAAFPGVTAGGVVDRKRLGERVLGDAAAMKRLEAIVHPLVREEEAAFRIRAVAGRASLAALDIPLLFETGGEDRVDAVVVVTAPADVQRARVLARPGMTPERFEALLARQLPDARKRARAHFVVDTGRGVDCARRQVGAIVRALAGVQGRTG